MAAESHGYVLDAGALGALDGRDESAKRVARVLAHALANDLDVVVPAGALAQAYYDGKKQARLSRLLEQAYIAFAALDVGAAKIIGPMRRTTKHDDVIDVHVALLAIARDFSVVTSDQDDMVALGVREERIAEV